ncbi:MAG: PolC-type DNA polymerase III [Lachnospiraceae bacterium]|nr:PolC-type DNA polymerase III [Lachnospiraceae bacterium]
MERPFLEVFANLKLRNALRAIFEDVVLLQLSISKNRDIVKLYILSNHLIPYRDKVAMEREIADQIFEGTECTVRIIEEYNLPDTYTASLLLTENWDSMMSELSDNARVVENCLKNAKIEELDPHSVKLTIPDSEIFKEREAEVLQYLKKVCCERCKMDASFAIVYEKRKTDNSKEAWDEYRIEQLVREKVAVPKATEDNKAAATEKAEADKPAKSSSGSKYSGNTKGKGDYGKRSGKSYGPRDRASEKSDNPNVIYGREFGSDESITPISDLVDDYSQVVINGKIIKTDRRETRSGKVILFLDITDFTDTVRTKIFISPEEEGEKSAKLSVGKWVRLKGSAQTDQFDHELTIGSIYGIMVGADNTTKRMDLSPEKRVELHCHTKMSDSDGISDVKDIVKCAYSWGHPAVAITDHGVVQGFPDANHTWEDLWKKEKEKRIAAGDEKPDKQDFFKVIYGVEGYLIDDLVETVVDSKGQSLDSDYVVFDIETTGFSSDKNKIIEIGAVKIKNGEIVDRFSEFVNPECPIPYRITQLTSITDADVKDADTIEMVLPEFYEFCRDCVLVAHNARFDTSFIRKNCERQGLPYEFTSVDTIGMSRTLLPKLRRFNLDAVSKELGIVNAHHHRAVDDAECTAEIFKKLLKMCAENDVHDLTTLNEFTKISKESIRKMPHPTHVILLAKNNTGRVNLYTLISMSHLDYFGGEPRIPKSKLMEYREGLIVGSACERGELIDALLDERGDDEIAKIVQFYDYLEIMPKDNLGYMVRDTERERYERFKTMADIEDLNRQIVRLGDMYGKPVCATGDVHFINPEEEIYRRIIKRGSKGPESKNADEPAPLYFRTTDEMLTEFGYLGSEKAREVVITNPNMIAAQIESMSPVRPDKCPPVIENSDETLKRICYTRAHEIYGPELPEIVSERLERELHSIITNGFAVMYIIAQKLVWKSVEDGYLVGSRGSVGSSFVATMAGITEVNPLVPHYYCSECHFYDFDSEEVKKFRGMAGVDMPDRVCPKCGAKLKKDGFDIPFETFLGFKGDKEPDIDLNFSGEYQSKAHRYTEVIFGAGQTFRAGTIATLADKTAYGYVKNYFEEKGVSKRSCEIERMVQGCVGVRRSTGQHPGGIIVLPVGEDINSFTPVQHPANDMTTDIITTHFDYHSIDHNLLKLDILGHDDPTMIRMLQDLTGIDPIQIPLDDPKVMSLFENTEALGVSPSDIGGCELGCLGIPEFGTDFSMGMVQEAKPRYFSDLIRIAGLSHGTDVWLNNAQDLIRNGTATISTAICTRDDIMTYLINKGVESEESFKIMEMVRKGKVAAGKCDKWEEWTKDMRACDVPEWYIESCQKIKYMFPRAHAAAYVMMAWRIAYCKVYYPLAYYAAFFSIRAKAFNYATMCQGRDVLEAELKKKRAMEHPSPKDEDAIRDMRIVQEMYARGYEFAPIDLFKAKSRLFSIVDGKIMPSFSSIEGLGENAADSIVEAAKKGPFISRDDFKTRAKVSQTVTDAMADLGILGDLPESNQISLFDFV